MANPDFKTMLQDRTLRFPASDLTANDTDAEGQRLSVIAVLANAETHGSVRLADGSVTYEPDAGFAGRAMFGYLVRDTGGATSIGNVYVTVVRARRPRVA
ncbi:Ig-like domain-containing protein [Candidatus Nitrospira bockiana]